MMRSIRRNPSERVPRRARDASPDRIRHSTAFGRRSLGLAARKVRRAASSPHPSLEVSPSRTPHSRPLSHPHTHPAPLSFDPLALVRRLPPVLAAFAYVKSARHLSVLSRFEKFWLELRSRVVVLILDDPGWPAEAAGAKESVIVGVFSLEACQIHRHRAKSSVLRISKPGHPQHIWLRFDDDRDCDVWEKAMRVAAAQRVVGVSDFEFISPIGKGASGKVFLVTDRKTGEKLALKVIDKTKVFESRSGFRHAIDERLALEMVDGHPFFSRLRYAFQTRGYFYLAIDFYDGGDLYQYLRTHQGRLGENQVRNVAAEVLLALEHVHSLGFVYRDLKPENVLLDSKGHVRLADFGLCKLLSNQLLTNTICGTHTYAAPEMLSVRNYGMSIDLWAFGVFVYHVLRGRTPYEARDLDQVIANMNNRRIRFSSNTSPELVSLIKKLLDWNPETRLGCGPGGMVEVRGHSFFQGLDWRKVFLGETEEGGLFMEDEKVGPTRIRTSPTSATSATSAVTGRGETTPKSHSTNASSCTTGRGGNEGGRTTSPIVAMSDAASSSPPASKTESVSLSGNAAATGGVGATGAATGTPTGITGTATSSSSTEITPPRKVKRLSRPKSMRLGRNRRERISNEGADMVSLRERMIAAAAQDDLRNFDMSEWGKISVDNDHDDANYGDGSLWPISKARRRLIEDERMIAGFSYCSSSTAFALPDNL